MKTNDLHTCRTDKLSSEATKLRAHPDLVGIGFGPKEKDGRITSDAAVKLYVRRKEKDKKALGDRLLPEKIGNSRTDVVALAPLRARATFTQRLRPVLGGASGAVHVPGLTYTGTLGMVVKGYGGFDGRFFVLSNNHVLANINEAHVGDPVLQPGTLDGGNLGTDVIGHLFDYVPLRFGNPSGSLQDQPKNKADAAIAEVTFGNVSREIFWVGYPKGWRTLAMVEQAVVDANGQLRVQKTGRTTAYTQGVVTDLGFDGWVDYEFGRFAYFEDQLLIEPGNFSDRGDSGSIILDTEERIIGLLFGGGATHTIANHIQDVWARIPAMDFSDQPV